ncbi:MAG TPA: SH3 domain-containing protein [Sphingomicrobium sp.]|nr:SH3 domain-containing protein [Sphingomicrobium sp.]
MKALSVTSAKATTAAPGTGRSSARRRPTPTSGDNFALSGPSHPPDPEYHAYRQDLADVALTEQVIASHYAEPVDRAITTATELRTGPSADAAAICTLEPGEAFAMLDDTLGWAWGYAGEDRRVGYVRSGAVRAP